MGGGAAIGSILRAIRAPVFHARESHELEEYSAGDLFCGGLAVHGAAT